MVRRVVSSPFNNPSAQPALVEMWRNNLRKSRTPPPDKLPLPSSINVVMDGGGFALSAGLAGLVEVRFPCRILACHLFAGSAALAPVAVTASVDLRLGRQGSWASGSSFLHGGTLPGITAAVESDVSVSDWIVNLEPGDLILYRLVSISGAATWLTLTLPVLRLDLTSSGTDDVIDGFGDDIVTSDGESVILRS